MFTHLREMSHQGVERLHGRHVRKRDASRLLHLRAIRKQGSNAVTSQLKDDEEHSPKREAPLCEVEERIRVGNCGASEHAERGSAGSGLRDRQRRVSP